MWFEELMGFAETSPAQVRERITVAGDRMTSSVNGRTYGCGRLTTPTLAELRARLVAEAAGRKGRPRLRELVGDVKQLHADPANAGALFQAASQFNLLEMVSPSVHPEEGVGIYENDRTQGPACAISCGAGTIFRNYFVPLDGQLGQTAAKQIDCLSGVGEALGNKDQRLWRMQNGYALLTPTGLLETSTHIRGMDASARDALRGVLRVGVHSDVEVTLPGGGHAVTQVYGSALPVAYGDPSPDWEPLARVVLEASYEAALIAGALNAARKGKKTVLLTLLGGGVFGNEMSWILAAIERALGAQGLGELDVAIVSYKRPNAAVGALVERLR